MIADIDNYKEDILLANPGEVNILQYVQSSSPVTFLTLYGYSIRYSHDSLACIATVKTDKREIHKHQ